MGTKHIVPRAEGQGGIGTATLGWGELFITNTTADSSTQGGKLTLTSNDGNAMQSGSRLGVIEFKGAESSSALTIGARIEAICDAAWTATENGASLKFFTTDANASESLVLTLDSNKLAVFTGAVAINGDLTVNGTQTTVNSQTVTIDDPVFTLGGDTDHTSDDNKDRGIEFRYYSGSAKLGFFGWDDSASAFTFIADASNSGETFSGSSGNVIFGNITGTLQTAAQTNITSVGALNGGTITSGFGAINNGSSTITTTGLISGGSLDIDNVLINGTTIGHTDDTDLMTLSSGVLTVAGELDAVSLDISGDADIDGTLEADVITVNGTALNTVIAGVTVTNATNSAHVLVTDNESTNENNLITFVEGATSSTGNVGLEMDGNLTYNPSTGTVTATGFSGNLTGTLQTAAQGNITSLGTLTTLTVDNVVINGTTIGHTNNSSLMTLASGSLTVAGNIAIPNDGTIGSAGTAGAIAIDSSGNTTFSQTIKAAGYADNSNGTRVMSLAFSSPNPNLVIADQSSGNISPSANTRTILSIAGTDNFLQLNRNVNGESNAQNGNVMLGATQSFNAIYSREVDNTDKEFRILTGTTARLTISSGGDTTLTASYSGNTFPFRVGYLDGSSTYTPTFVIEDNGKVGIGLSVTDPVKTLDVRGQLAISNSASSYWYLDRNDSSGNFDIINDSNQVKITIASNGVATFSNYIDTPEVRQGGEFMIGRSSNIIRIGSGDGSDSLSFYAGGSERLTISTLGTLVNTANSNNGSTSIFKNISSTTPYGIAIELPNGSSDETRYFVYCGLASNAPRFKVSTAGTIYAVNQSVQSISDVRFKENIRDLDTGLSEILQLKPRLFDWKEGKGMDTKDSVGFIAQEIEEILPKLVDDNWSEEGIDEKGAAIEGEKYKTVGQGGLIPTLVKAIQEQQTIIEDLKSRIETLEG